MNLTQLLILATVSIAMITPNHLYQANATCVIGPNGSTTCAGMSQTTNVGKSSSNASINNGSADVIITLDCATNDIRYGDYYNTCYQPSTLYVKLGTIVTWQNDDTWQHTVTYGNPWSELSQGYFFDSKAIGQGERFSYQFKYSGVYPYFDSYNWWETGLVIVK